MLANGVRERARVCSRQGVVGKFREAYFPIAQNFNATNHQLSILYLGNVNLWRGNNIQLRLWVSVLDSCVIVVGPLWHRRNKYIVKIVAVTFFTSHQNGGNNDGCYSGKLNTNFSRFVLLSTCGLHVGLNQEL
jgi:hypothetical protein